MRKHQFSLLGKYHQALVLAKELRHDEKALHKVQHHLFHKYSEDIITHLNERKEKQVLAHPEKTAQYDKEYDEELRKRAREFVDDLARWTDELNVVFAKLDRLVEFDDRSESDDLLQLGELLKSSADYKGPFVFMEKDIARFKKTFRHFESQLLHDTKRDYRNDKREEHGEEPKKMGFLRMHESDGKLAKALKRAVKRFSEDEQHLHAVLQRVQQQLQQGVKPDFIVLFEGYIDEFALLERAIRIIREDVRALVIHHIREHNKVAKRTYMFSTAIHPVFKEIHISEDLVKKIDEFENGKDGQDPVGQKAIDFANREGQGERAIYGELKRDDRTFRTFYDRIENDKGKIVKAYEQVEHPA